MAKREIERTVQPSLLDRLTDQDPRGLSDQRVSYAESVHNFKLSVQRDLEWLLNCRRTPDPAPESYEELQSSVYHFGIIDVTSLGESADSRARLLKQVDEALAMFEPRLTNVNISIVDQEGESRRRELRFVVEGTLRLDPTPEQVAFDTVLHFSTGEIDVKGAAAHA
ncbi:MAG: type VI secretion system baseplate subunit TssE [Gemmatimonadaceae bacterium]